MKIEWINKDNNINAVTLYNNNITLSKQAALLFEDAYGVAVGVDTEDGCLVLKKVTKEEILKKEIEKENVYLVTMKPSFGRINSKKLILEIQRFLDLNFEKQTSYKFSAKWHNGNKMLIIDTKEVIKHV